MILIADSGSTKCDWMLISDEGNEMETKTMGFNPFFHTSNLVEGEIRRNDVLHKWAKKVTHVYFYGAGCSSKDRNQVIEDALKASFSNLVVCVVDHDLLGACLATAGDDQGIACIIGTGSNSCYFDGKAIHEEVPALGYVLGDEGSGSYFGRIMLRDWLYKHMPAELASAFQERYQLTKEKILTSVYNKPNANVYLASFMRFASDHRDHPYFKTMIYEGLEAFADIHILCYGNYREYPVHFVGSIAYYFEDVLKVVAQKKGFNIGVITKKPINSLASYHRNNLKSKV